MKTKKRKENSVHKRLLNYMKNSCFVESFKFEKKHLFVVLFDYIYYILFIFFSTLYIYRILPKLDIMQEATPLLQEISLSPTTISAEALSQISSIESAMFQFKFYSIVISVLLIISYCFFKYLIWRFLLNKKLDLKSFGKFIILNILIFITLLITILLTYTITKIEIFPILLILIFLLLIYFICLLHPIFNITDNLIRSIKITFSKGITRCYHFIIPYITFFIVLVLMFFYIIPMLVFLPDMLHLFVVLLVIVLYLTWTKLYILAVLKKLKIK